MARGWQGNQPRPQKKCWCGSGKKQKHCHGLPAERQAEPAPPKQNANSNKIETVAKPWGVPGEEHKLIVAPVFRGTAGPTQADIRGEYGRYRVHFLLARPGYPIRSEREFKFIDGIVGTSHLKIAKPEAERGPTDIEKLLLSPLGRSYQFVGLADKDGFLGKLECELDAESNQAAEAEAYGAVTPFLSAWSMNADIPIHIETIQVTNIKTHVSHLRVVTPHFEMNFPGGVHPHFQDDFCQYASVYREGLNSNSPFYRFLCFYKIIESLIARRGREAKARKLVGNDPRHSYEVIPENREEILALLKRLYPWRIFWDEMGLGQNFPPEVLGKKVTAVKDKHLQPLRLGIAHALLKTGEITVVLDKMEHIQAVNKWLPLCQICARWMMLTDFPNECSLAMK